MERALTQQLAYDGLVLRVDCYFSLEGRRLKVCDPDNFLKACLDGISRLLNIDDKYFYGGHREKVRCMPGEQERTIVCIQTVKSRTSQDVHKELVRP